MAEETGEVTYRILSEENRAHMEFLMNSWAKKGYDLWSFELVHWQGMTTFYAVMVLVHGIY